MLPRALPDGRDGFLPVAGGAIFNTAVALGRLGEDAGFFGGLSTDIFGRKLCDTLERSHVNFEHCVRTARPSTLAFVELIDGAARYSFVDENSAGRMLRASDLPEFDDSASAFQFGGISLMLEPCGTAFESLMEKNHRRSVVFLDPNIRGNLIKQPTAYRNRLARLIKMSDIVKVSDLDLAWLAPGEDFSDVAARWIKLGVRVVLQTAGESDMRAITADGEVVRPVETTRAVDTVGAGDAFNAGFLACLNARALLTKPALETIRMQDIADAVEFASYVAAHSVGKAGADSPWRSELNDKARALYP
ncbi:MAG: carbohydrate kinase family protein [bacterium]